MLFRSNLSGALSEWSGGTLDSSQASQVMAKALTGERDGLKQLGIVVSDEIIKNRLEQEGKDKLTGLSLQRAKAEITLSEILRQSTDAQAQYAAGSDTLARQQAQMAAELKTFATDLATGLLPVFKGMFEAVRAGGEILSEYKGEIMAGAAGIGIYVAATKLMEAEDLRLIAIQRIKIALMEAETLLAKATPYAIMATAAIALYSVLKEVNTELTELNARQKGFADASKIANDHLKQFNSEVASEKQKLDNLFGALNEANKGHGNKAEIIKQINQEYGKYIGNINLETASQEQLKVAYDKAGQAIINQMVAKQKSATISDIMKEYTDAQVKLTEAQARIVDETQGIRGEVFDESDMQKAHLMNEHAKKEADDLTKRMEGLKDRMLMVAGQFDEAAKKMFSNFSAEDIKKLFGSITGDSDGTEKEKNNAAAEKLSEQLLSSTEKFKDAVEKANQIITDSSLNAIENRYEKERQKIIQETEKNIRQQAEALQKAANDRIRVLNDALKLGNNLLGTPEQIKSEIQSVTIQAQESIKNQTEALKQAQANQLKELEKSRQQALSQAQDFITNIINTRSAESAKAGAQKTDALIQTVQLETKYNKAQSEIEFSKEQADLELSLATKKISQERYSDELQKLKLKQQIREFELDRDSLRLLDELNAAKLTKEIEYIQAKQLMDVKAAKNERDNDLKTVDDNLKNGLFTTEKAEQARIEINQRAEDKIKTIQQNALDEKRNTEAKFNAERTQNLKSSAQQEVDIEKGKNKKIIEDEDEMKKKRIRAALWFIDQLGSAISKIEQIEDNNAAARHELALSQMEERHQRELQIYGTTQARKTQIDKKYAAEKKRLDDEYAKEKKRGAIAQAVIDGALGAMKIVAQYSAMPAVMVPLLVAEAVQTALQIGVISSQKFAHGGILPSGDGMIRGRSHSQGGVKFGAYEAEGGEWMARTDRGTAILSRRATSMYLPLLQSLPGGAWLGKAAYLSELNASAGGRRFAEGGLIPNIAAPIQVGDPYSIGQNTALLAQMITAFAQQKVVLPVKDLDSTQQDYTVVSSIKS